MARLAVLALVAALVAGCGSSKHAATTTAPASPARLLGAGAKVLYAGGDWAVVTRGTDAVAAHLVNGKWQADRSGVVKVDILGPKGKKAVHRPQVAAEITGPSRLVEEGLWVDGRELVAKGGGLTPSKVTVYGAPDANLEPGRHIAIAYGRTAGHGTAVTWSFTVV